MHKSASGKRGEERESGEDAGTSAQAGTQRENEAHGVYGPARTFADKSAVVHQRGSENAGK